jgi:hypothetical protein
MLGESLTALIMPQRNRPLSLVVAAFALFAPGSLTIFLSRPGLFTTVGLHGVLLLSIAVSLPIVMLCFGIWYTPLSAISRAQRLIQGIPEDADIVKAVSAEDPLEWPCLLTGSWTALLILYVIATIAYSRPIEIGATFLLTATILFVVWVLAMVLSVFLSIVVQRKAKQSSSEVPLRNGPV